MEYFPSTTSNFHAIIFLSKNSVKFNSISDYFFDKNVPFGVENEVLRRLRILPKWEYSALPQLYIAHVSNNTASFFFVILFSGEYLINSQILYHIYLMYL